MVLDEVNDPELAKAIYSVCGHDRAHKKMLISQLAQGGVAILMAWDDTNKCYRKVNCDSSGKLVVDMS